MLTPQDNERLTRVGPGTPMGELMRRYWVPALFSDQLPKPDCPPVRVKLLCEELVAFRDTSGAVGLIDEYCPHRLASMFFGRNEENGLRCVYHGIKFDREGNCVDVPCIAPGTTTDTQMSAIKRQMKTKSYPCMEKGGVIWTYMGPADKKPEFPDLEWAEVPADQRHATRRIQECNWLQGVEGGYDAPHLTFLHGGSAEPSRHYLPSLYEVVPTDFGFVVGTARDMGGPNYYWNINIFLMPFHKIISSVPHAAHMWMPIDDENTMLYSIDFKPKGTGAFTEQEMKRSITFNGIHTENIPGTDRPIANRDNDYLIDRELQASGKSFTGMKGLGIQDAGIQESMGAIVDRTKEHLLIGDTAITKIRDLLLKTIDDLQAGRAVPGLDPKSFRVRSTRYEAPKTEPFKFDRASIDA